MANSRSARKRIRSNEAKRLRNRTVRTAVRTKIARTRKLAVGSAAVEEITTQLRLAIKSLDKAGEKGILHRNNVARRKSRLMSQVAGLLKVHASPDSEEAKTTKARATGTSVAKKKPAAKTAAKPAAAKAKAKATAGTTRKK